MALTAVQIAANTDTNRGKVSTIAGTLTGLINQINSATTRADFERLRGELFNARDEMERLHQEIVDQWNALGGQQYTATASDRSKILAFINGIWWTNNGLPVWGPKIQNAVDAADQRIPVPVKAGQAAFDALQTAYAAYYGGDVDTAHAYAQFVAGEYNTHKNPGFIAADHDEAERQASLAEGLIAKFQQDLPAWEALYNEFITHNEYDAGLILQAQNMNTKMQQGLASIVADAEAARRDMDLWDGKTHTPIVIDDGLAQLQIAETKAAELHTKAAQAHVALLALLAETNLPNLGGNLAEVERLLHEIEAYSQDAKIWDNAIHQANLLVKGANGATTATRQRAQTAETDGSSDHTAIDKDLSDALAAYNAFKAAKDAALIPQPPTGGGTGTGTGGGTGTGTGGGNTQPPTVPPSPVPIWEEYKNKLIAQAVEGVAEVEARNLDAMQRTKFHNPLDLLKAAAEMERRGNNSGARVVYAKTGKGLR
jgi:hypothetical protein